MKRRTQNSILKVQIAKLNMEVALFHHFKVWVLEETFGHDGVFCKFPSMAKEINPLGVDTKIVREYWQKYEDLKQTWERQCLT